jgi:eukaryotic-like serine/threonine-protein kinase
MTSKYDPDRFRRVDALFDAALELPPEDRPAFLDSVCGDDIALRTEVDSLLESVDTSESMFGENVADYAAPLIAEMPHDLDDPAVEPGTLFGPWRIVEEIGRGGMGSVYLAERADDAFDLRVAIKLVKRGMDSAEVLRRFQRSAAFSPRSTTRTSRGSSTRARPRTADPTWSWSTSRVSRSIAGARIDSSP